MEEIKVLILVFTFLRKDPEFKKTTNKSVLEIKRFFQEVAENSRIIIEEIYENLEWLKIFEEIIRDWLDKNNKEITYLQKNLDKEIKEFFCLADWVKIINFYRAISMYQEADCLVNYCSNNIQKTENKSEDDVFLLIESAFIKLHIGDIDKALNEAKFALSIAQDVPRENDDILVHAHICYSEINGNIGDTQESIKELEKALELEKNISKDVLFRLLNKRISHYLYRPNKCCKNHFEKDINKAKTLFKKSVFLRKKIFQQEDESYDVVGFLINEHYLAMYDQNYEQAIESVNKAITISIKHSQDNSIPFGGLLNMLGVAYMEKGDKQKEKSDKLKSYREAEKNLEDSFNLNIKVLGIQNIHGAKIQLQLAELYSRKNNIYKANEKLEYAKNITEKLEVEYLNDIEYLGALCEIRELKSLILKEQIQLGSR